MCKAIDDYTEKGHMRQNFCVEHNINSIIYQLLDQHKYNYKT